MSEKLSMAEIIKYCWIFLGSASFLVLSLGMIYFTVNIDMLYQYIELPDEIEHNRYVFIILVFPSLFFFALIESVYCLVTKQQFPKKYAIPIGKYVLYALVITMFGVTPVFSIGSGFYLDHHGYKRCPDNNIGLASITTIDYSKSLEYCPLQ